PFLSLCFRTKAEVKAIVAALPSRRHSVGYAFRRAADSTTGATETAKRTEKLLFTRNSTSLLGVALLAAGAMFAAPAMAQDTNAPEQSAPSVTAPDPAPTDSGQADFSDDKLKSFAVAFLEVDKITKEYMPKLKEAASTEQQQEVRNEAGAKMVRAVEE